MFIYCEYLISNSNYLSILTEKEILNVLEQNIDKKDFEKFNELHKKINDDNNHEKNVLNVRQIGKFLKDFNKNLDYNTTIIDCLKERKLNEKNKNIFKELLINIEDNFLDLILDYNNGEMKDFFNLNILFFTEDFNYHSYNIIKTKEHLEIISDDSLNLEFKKLLNYLEKKIINELLKKIEEEEVGKKEIIASIK